MDSQVASSGAPCPQAPAPEKFKVVIARLADGRGRKIAGKGELVLDGATLRISGRVPGTGFFGLWNQWAEVAIPLSEVFNVVVGGNLLSMERVRDGFTVGMPTVRAASRADAARIAGSLPTETTPEFLERRKKADAFASALNTATPRVFVTHAVIAINVLVFVAMGVAGAGWFKSDLGKMVQWGADFWPLTTGGEWWRLLTSEFLLFGLFHLGLYMWGLSSVGILTERLYGNWIYALIYLFGALTSSLAAVWWDSHEIIGAGASGAIFAVYGALLAYLVCQSASFPKGAVRPMLKSNLTFIAYNVFYGMTHGGISNAAHLGGLAGGLLLGVVLSRPLALEQRTRQALPRLAGGGILGIAVLSAAFVCLPKYGGDVAVDMTFRTEMQSVSAEVDILNSRYRRLAGQANAGLLDDGKCARLLDENLIPRWQGLASRMSAVALGGESPLRPLQQKWTKYCQLQCDALRTLSEGLKTGDERKMKEAAALMDKADKVASQTP